MRLCQLAMDPIPIIAELRLDCAPDCVRLLREAQGSAPAALDSCEGLAEQGVVEGSRVLVEVLQPPALLSLLPQPLTTAAHPAAAPHEEYWGLERSARHTLFYASACAQASPDQCPISGTRIWRLNDPTAPTTNLKWPFLGAWALVERDFYARFLQESQWLGGLGGRQCKVAVLGQPGTGKSAFGIWLLAHLLRSSRTVVYSRNFSKPGVIAADVKHLVFHRGVAFRLRVNDLGCIDALLQDPAVVHICDNLKPQSDAECHKVLITSPDPGVWRWFVEKEYASTAHFPLYSYAELEALRAAEFGPSLPPETLALRVHAYGLNTRSVFSPKQREVKRAVVKALLGRGLEELQRYMGEVASPTGVAANDMPHTLFTLQADRETLSEGEVTFCSQAVERRVARQVATLSRSSLIPALQHLLAGSHTRSVAGAAFEQAAIDVLGRGRRRDFAVRRLSSDSPAKARPLDGRVLPAPTAMHHFVSLSDLAQKCASGAWDLRTQCFKPTSPNLAAIDFIGPALSLFQVTVNRSSHDLKVTSGRSQKEGLAAVYLELLPLLEERWGAEQPHLDVYFVVPTGSAGEWRAQNLVAAPHRAPLDATAAAAATAAALKHAVKIVQTSGGGSGFSIGGRVVEVRQHTVEMPDTVFSDWLEMPEPLRDAIDEAAES